VTVARLDLGATNVLGWVRRDPSVDVSEAIEATHRRQPTIDRGRGETALLHRGAVQLDVRPSRVEDEQLVVGRPLEEGTQVVPIRLQRSPAIAGQKRRNCQFRLVNRRRIR
jgi:hypothetical protein